MRVQHFDELEADFQQYYNLNLADILPERASRLLFQLPSGCRVFAALNPAAQWGWTEALLNKANYMLEVLAWQKANEGVKRSKQTAKPQPFVPDFMKDRTISKDIEVHDTDSVKALLAKPRS